MPLTITLPENLMHLIEEYNQLKQQKSQNQKEQKKLRAAREKKKNEILAATAKLAAFAISADSTNPALALIARDRVLRTLELCELYQEACEQAHAFWNVAERAQNTTLVQKYLELAEEYAPQIKSPEAKAWCFAAIVKGYTAFCNLLLNEKKYPQANTVIEYALALNQSHPSSTSKLTDVELYFYQTRYHFELKQYTATMVAGEKALKKAENHPVSMVMLYQLFQCLAFACENMQNYEKAAPYYLKVLEAAALTEDKASLKVIGLYHNAAVFFRKTGDRAQAIKCTNYIVDHIAERKTRQLPDDPTYVTFYYEAGLLYQSMAYLEVAKANYLIAFNYGLTLDPDSLQLPSLSHLLGTIYQAQEKWEAAIIAYKKSLERFKQHYPADHPDILSTVNDLATVYAQQGEFSLAKATYNEHLSQLAPDCDKPEAAMFMLNAACLLSQTTGSDTAEAEALIQRSRTIHDKCFPDLTNSTWLRFHMQAANAFENIKNYAKARESTQQALVHYQTHESKGYNEQSAHAMAVCYLDLARLASLAGDIAGAIDICRTAMQFCEKYPTLTTADVDLIQLALVNNLIAHADTLQKNNTDTLAVCQACLEEALPVAQALITKHEVILKHVDITSPYDLSAIYPLINNLAMIYTRLGSGQEAAEVFARAAAESNARHAMWSVFYLKKAIGRYKKLPAAAARSRGMARAYQELAHLYWDEKLYDAAIIAIRKAIHYDSDASSKAQLEAVLAQWQAQLSTSFNDLDTDLYDQWQRAQELWLQIRVGLIQESNKHPGLTKISYNIDIMATGLAAKLQNLLNQSYTRLIRQAIYEPLHSLDNEQTDKALLQQLSFPYAATLELIEEQWQQMGIRSTPPVAQEDEHRIPTPDDEQPIPTPADFSTRCPKSYERILAQQPAAYYHPEQNKTQEHWKTSWLESIFELATAAEYATVISHRSSSDESKRHGLIAQHNTAIRIHFVETRPMLASWGIARAILPAAKWLTDNEILTIASQLLELFQSKQYFERQTDADILCHPRLIQIYDSIYRQADPEEIYAQMRDFHQQLLDDLPSDFKKYSRHLTFFLIKRKLHEAQLQVEPNFQIHIDALFHHALLHTQRLLTTFGQENPKKSPPIWQQRSQSSVAKFDLAKKGFKLVTLCEKQCELARNKIILDSPINLELIRAWHQQLKKLAGICLDTGKPLKAGEFYYQAACFIQDALPWLALDYTKKAIAILKTQKMGEKTPLENCYLLAGKLYQQAGALSTASKQVKKAYKINANPDISIEQDTIGSLKSDKTKSFHRAYDLYSQVEYLHKAYLNVMSLIFKLSMDPSNEVLNKKFLNAFSELIIGLHHNLDQAWKRYLTRFRDSKDLPLMNKTVESHFPYARDENSFAEVMAREVDQQVPLADFPVEVMTAIKSCQTFSAVQQDMPAWLDILIQLSNDYQHEGMAAPAATIIDQWVKESPHHLYPLKVLTSQAEPKYIEASQWLASTITAVMKTIEVLMQHMPQSNRKQVPLSLKFWSSLKTPEMEEQERVGQEMHIGQG